MRPKKLKIKNAILMNIDFFFEKKKLHTDRNEESPDTNMNVFYDDEQEEQEFKMNSFRENLNDFYENDSSSSSSRNRSSRLVLGSSLSTTASQSPNNRRPKPISYKLKSFSTRFEPPSADANSGPGLYTLRMAFTLVLSDLINSAGSRYVLCNLRPYPSCVPDSAILDRVYLPNTTITSVERSHFKTVI